MISFSPVPIIPLGPFLLSIHGVMIAIGFLVAFVAARGRAKRFGFDLKIVDNLATLVLVAGFIGARIAYVAVLGDDMSFWQMLKVWEGGLSSHGGYIAGILAGIGYVRYKKLPVVKHMDFFLPYFLLGWAIGRIGCILVWEDVGMATVLPWAFNVSGVPQHPTLLYEALASAVGFAVLMGVRDRWSPTKAPGVMASFSLCYFVGQRFVIDFLRDYPSDYYWFSQTVTFAIMIGSLMALGRVWMKRQSEKID